MARGFVRKRGTTWHAYWRDLQGKQRSKAIGSRKHDAEHFLTEVQSSLLDGSYRETRPIGFAEFAEQFHRDYATVHVKPSTLLGYRSMLDCSLIPFFGDMKLSTIGTADVQRFVALRLSEGRKATTVRKHLGLLKTMLKQATLWGYLKQNPALAVKQPRAEYTQMDFMTPEEIRHFLPHVDDWYRPLFATAILTGMRLGELLGLQWDDIEWHVHAIRVQRSLWHGQFVDPKSKRSVRAIGMSPTLASILIEYKTLAPRNEHDLVFVTPEGRMIDGANLRHRVFEESLKRAGMRKMRIHDLRHTYASLLINQGENLKFVQQQLGHASIQTTVDRYGHLMPDAHIGASERLDATVFGNGPETLAAKMLPSATGQQNRPDTFTASDLRFCW